MEKFIFYFFLFFLYAVLGWIIEVIYVYFLDKKFVNRGFLIGPYLPIYGYSAIIMVLYLNQYKENPLTVIILAMVVCTFLEYITSYMMEKLFKARGGIIVIKDLILMVGFVLKIVCFLVFLALF